MANTTSAARPKRPAEIYNGTQSPSAKKPRFDYRNPSTLAPDAPEEDLILDADVIGKSGAQIKRNAVNIDGYESDSDNDNFNERAAEREKRAKADGDGRGGPAGAGSKDEEEDDMFADLEAPDGDEDEEVSKQGKKKKDVRFLEEREIEGQVLSSTSGGHVSADLLLNARGKQKQRAQSEDSESSGEDEDRDELDPEMDDEVAAELGAGGKKKHAPRLDAFNLQQEQDDGRFDESGNYVRKAVDPDAVNDNWLDGLSKKDIKRAREAQEKRDEEQRAKAAADDALLTSDLLSTLIGHLEAGETALECLQRLNKGKRKEAKVPKWKAKKLRNGMDVDEDGSEESLDPAEVVRRRAVEAVTGAADALYGREQHEIYDTEREMLMRQYKRETGEDWVAPVATEGGVDIEDGDGVDENAEWEYRWSDARDGGEHHGPYDGATMKAWNEAGYFGEGVEFRRVEDEEWSRVLDVR